jgi:BMFP domain-containing protein YqiC
MNLQELMWVKEKLAELESRLERLEAARRPRDGGRDHREAPAGPPA